MSEYMSLVLEPVARRMDSMEINASGGLLSVIENINDDLKSRKSSSHEEEEGPPQEDEDQPSNGGPCHQYGGGRPNNKQIPGKWPNQPSRE